MITGIIIIVIQNMLMRLWAHAKELLLLLPNPLSEYYTVAKSKTFWPRATVTLMLDYNISRGYSHESWMLPLGIVHFTGSEVYILHKSASRCFIWESKLSGNT